MLKFKFFKLINIFLLCLIFIFIFKLNKSFAVGIGEVAIHPQKVVVGSTTNLSFVISTTSTESIYEVNLIIPFSWRFTLDKNNIVLEGQGMQFATIYELSGLGYQGKEFTIKIKGCSITKDKTGQISLVNITAPLFISNQSPLNRFIFKTKTLTQANVDEIANSPYCITYNPNSKQPVLLISEIACKNTSNDYIEIYCKDDGNFGNGIDIKDWKIVNLENDNIEKRFNSLIIKTGCYLMVRYNLTTNDDIFPSINVANTYTIKNGLEDNGFILTIQNELSNIIDAIVCVSNNYEPNGNALMYLFSKKQWNSIDKKSGIDITNMLPKHSIARISNSIDTNSKDDFKVMAYQTPQKPNGNVGIKTKILINEFKAGSGNGNDFIELYVLDDGMGGGGVDIIGYEISDGINFNYECGENFIVKTNDYIVISFNSNTNNVTRNGNIILVSTTITGLSKIFGALTIKNSTFEIIDAVCYTSGPINNENYRQKLKELILLGHIVDMSPPFIYDENDCVLIKNQPTGSSFGRNSQSVDTNSQTDFTNFLNPTIGKPNINKNLPIAFTITNTSNDIIYSALNSEVKITINAIDINNEIAILASNGITIFSDATTTLFSEDGINYVQKLNTNLKLGTKQIYVKDTSYGTKTITICDQLDNRLIYKFKFIVNEKHPIQINEIMYYPPASLVKNPYDLQWIELYNNSSKKIDISGYKIKCNNTSYTVPNEIFIESNSFIVITTRLQKLSYREDNSFSDVYGNKDGIWNLKDGFLALEANNLKLPLNYGKIILCTPDDVEISVVEYSNTQGANGNGKTLEKAQQNVVSIGNLDVDRYNFLESLKINGTPGEINSRNQGNITSLTLEHTPITTTSANVPLTIYAKANNVTEIEVGYRNSKVNGIFSFIKMIKIDNTNVYRTVIPASEITTDGIDYYIRAFDNFNNAKYSPNNGPDNPYKVNVIDDIAKLYLKTPIQLVAPNTTFFVDVYIENAPNISDIYFELYYNPTYFLVEDLDNVRPGIQIGIGSMFTKYYCEQNDVNLNEGKIVFKLIDETKSSGPNGQVAKIKFKTKENFGQTYPEYVNLTFKNVIISSNANVEVFNNKIKIGDTSTLVVGISGGTVGGENQAKLIIPPGAVKVDTKFSIKKILKSEAPSSTILDNTHGITTLDVLYEFQPYNFKFQKPVTVEIPFTQADLNAFNIKDSKNIKIYFYNPKTLSYERLGGVVSSNKVTAKINELNLLMLVYDEQKNEFELNDIFVYPNPFSPNGNGWNDSTFINFTTTMDAITTIKIYDVRGILIRRLLNNENLPAGRNKIEWDGKDDFGKIVKTGIYLYQIKTINPLKITKTYQGTIVVSKNLKD